MRIHAKLHCQNMQKNTTLQGNDLKIPAKFGMRMGGGTDISLGLTAAEVGDLIKVKSVDENGKPTAWEKVETIDGTLTEASDNSLGITSATVGQIAKITAIDDKGKPTEWIGTKLAQEIKANDYPITITESTDLTGYNGGPAYLPDKENEEIEAAYASGANLYVVYEGMTVPLTGVSAEAFAFSGFLPSGEGMSFTIYRGKHSIEYRAARDVYNTGILNQLKTNYGPYIVQEDPTGEKLSMTVPVPAESDKGKILTATEYGNWEIADMPPQKSLKWITVYSTTLTEATNNIVVSADANGKPIADYNPVGLTLLIATPADATQGSNNGSPWVYPSATKSDNAIRAIGTIAGWKTIARDSAFAFMGNSSVLTCTGNVNTTLSSYKIDGYKLDGVKAYLNNANDHFSVGTRVDVNILSEIIS